MIYDTQQTAPVRNWVLLASAAAWAALLFKPASTHMSMHHPESLRMMMVMGHPIGLAADWVLMVAAMMLPLLFPLICHMRMRSFAHRRARSIAIFLFGYFAMWMAAGIVLLGAASLFTTQSYLPAVGVLLIAMVWQCSPFKQRCLNRCHSHTELAAFGVAADLDALRFGAIQGTWCVGSCWALMLLPMLLPTGHIAVMAIVTVLVFSERLEHPRPPDWRWRGFGKVRRLITAQTQIRLRALQSWSTAHAANTRQYEN